MEDKEDENHACMDAKTNKKDITNIVVAEKHIIGIEKDDDVSFDAVVDIAKLFDTLSLLGNFSVYVFPKQLSSIIFKQRRKLKKSYFLQPLLINHTNIRKIKNEGETPPNFNHL